MYLKIVAWGCVNKELWLLICWLFETNSEILPLITGQNYMNLEPGIKALIQGVSQIFKDIWSPYFGTSLTAFLTTI